MAANEYDDPKRISERITTFFRVYGTFMNLKPISSALEADSHLFKLFLTRRVLTILKLRKNRIGGDDQWH